MASHLGHPFSSYIKNEAILNPKNLIKFHFLMTTCSYIFKIVVSRNETPTIYSNIFWNFCQPIFNPHFPIFY